MDGQNYDSQDRASIAASRGKNAITADISMHNDEISNGYRPIPRRCGGQLCGRSAHHEHVIVAEFI